jgi:hypothetical protein
MNNSPLINAAAALLYIVALVLFIFYGLGSLDGEDTVLAPIAMLSLFTLSAAVMGYLFLLEPARLLLGGQREEGVRLFVRTVGYFAGLVVLVCGALFLTLR